LTTKIREKISKISRVDVVDVYALGPEFLDDCLLHESGPILKAEFSVVVVDCVDEIIWH